MWQGNLNLSELPDATAYNRIYSISTDLLILIILLQTFKLLQKGLHLERRLRISPM